MWIMIEIENYTSKEKKGENPQFKSYLQIP